MRLKKYQTEALAALSNYLKLLADAEVQTAQANAAIAALPENVRESVPAPRDPVSAAWDTARKANIAASPDPWRPVVDGVGRSIPHICLKLPTGGGKTLLAAHGLERISADHFRKTTGLVLWIVPSDAIYRQTKKQLTDRENPIRQVLDRMSGGRVKVLQKLDAFTRQDLQEGLCVLLLMLPSANRETRESLKVFRDSGHYESLFPHDDRTACEALLKETPNLELFGLAEAAQVEPEASRIKHSLGNVLRLARPIVVLDEGHHAYGELARATLSTLNPRFVLELTATPKREFSNILVNVSGRALKDEEMIKLPIRLEVAKNLSWKATLQRAVDRLDAIERDARDFQNETNRYIRPILLVRVDRTGKDQRGGGYVHAEDVVAQLTNKVGLPREAVRIQTAEVKELKDDDLLSPYCPVRAIVTKDALREGWDCPFAYVLAILSSGTATTALTQMIGRVLRQPGAERTGREPLDEAHVFCAEMEVGEAVARIKSGLEAEGMGDLGDQIDTGKGKDAASVEKETRIRKAFRGSQIMLPRVLHRCGKLDYRELDFEADILPGIDWDGLSWRDAETFSLADYDKAQRTTFAVDIDEGERFVLGTSARKSEFVPELKLERAALVRRMLDVVPNPWQGMRILDDAIARLMKRDGVTEDNIIAAKFQLIEAIQSDVREQFDRAAEGVFRRKVETGEILFKLLAAPLDSLNFEFEEIMKVRVGHDDLPLFRYGDPLARSLYDKVFQKDVNGFEEEVALYLDGNDAVTWWWRIVARKGWALQGWRRNRIYPDFLIKLESNGDTARMLVLETKGEHLAGSHDTMFKEKLFALLEQAYENGQEAGDVELFAGGPDAMSFRILLQHGAWKSEIEHAIS
ncbi:MAG TPA: DEAD/DEAH box helicase family protein [Rhizomicrobium sp.]